MSPRVALQSRVIDADRFPRRVRLYLEGDASALAAVAGVEYDLGPTFSERYRRGETGAADFGVETAAYGDFTVAAEVTFNRPVTGPAPGPEPPPTELLVHRVVIPPPPESPREAPDAAAPRTARPSLRSLPARSGVALELFVSTLAFVTAYLAIAVWPDGTGAVRLLGGPFALTFPAGRGARLLLLAAASGGLGAVLQSAVALIRHPGTRTLTAAWLRWYLLRPVVGAGAALLAYAGLRIVFFVPGADPAAIASWGVAALGVGGGLASGRMTTGLTRAFEVVFRAFLSEPTYSTEEGSVSTSAASPSGTPSREEQRRSDVAQAESVLRGGDLPAKEIYQLAERLKDNNKFGLARKLFARIRARNDYAGLGKSPVKVGQRHALCTYKDPDLPAADRFQRALEILAEVDRMEMTPAERQESLGLKGAVHKRRWQVSGQRGDLERSLGYYTSGYELGPETDQGYTGINAAFVLDLLARDDAKQAVGTGARWMVADEECKRARTIRQRLTEVLPRLVAAPGGEWLRKEWWYYTTLAEAWLGLGEFNNALTALRAFNREFDLGHDGPPVELLPPWEFESTITQLAALAELQADLAGLLGSRPERSEEWPSPPAELRQRAKQMLTEYLGALAPGVSRAFTGKVGLALSGGGFRASLFHLGVLACLAERDMLRRVEVLSCVSGGSIVGAHFYLEVKRLLETKPEQEIGVEDYVALVERLERDFLAGIQTNIRSRVFSSFWANLRVFLQPSYTTTRRLGALYERELYGRVLDGRGGSPRHLVDLLVNPQGEKPEFTPKYDNWRRSAKVPILVLNATTLNTGHVWQFTASFMGEPPSSLDAELEGNYRLRRMYHWEAPRLRDKWRSWLLRPFAPPDYQRFRLGEAVAASSSVPGLFEPLVLADLYDGKTVRLVDGGVYDNQGVASLLEQDCNVMLVSDASGQMEALDHPSGSRLEVPLRSFSVSMARVRQAQFQELSARTRSGLLKGLAFLHLKKDLDADPVDWRECQDPYEASDEARPAERRGVETRYHMPKAVQRLLAGIRTDLDSFTETEAFSLMTSGYRMAETEFAKLEGFDTPGHQPRNWRFLQIEPALRPGPGYDDLSRQLHTARLVFGKVWLLALPLTVLAGALGLAALFGVWRLWQANQSLVLVTVRGLGIAVVTLVAVALVPNLVRAVRFRELPRDLGLQALLAAVLALGFKLHLLLFDPLFLRLGRARRFIAMRGKTS